MKHLNEAELIEHYYEESVNMADCERHLKACAACAKRFADLPRSRRVKPLDAAGARRRLWETVWQSIRSSLPVLRKS